MVVHFLVSLLLFTLTCAEYQNNLNTTLQDQDDFNSTLQLYYHDLNVTQFDDNVSTTTSASFPIKKEVVQQVYHKLNATQQYHHHHDEAKNFTQVVKEDSEKFAHSLQKWVHHIVTNSTQEKEMFYKEYPLQSQFQVKTHNLSHANKENPCAKMVVAKSFKVLERIIEDPQLSKKNIKKTIQLLWKPDSKCLKSHQYSKIDGGFISGFNVSCGKQILLSALAVGGGKTYIRQFVPTYSVAGVYVGVNILNGSVDIAGGSIAGYVYDVTHDHIEGQPKRIVQQLHRDLQLCAANHSLNIQGFTGVGWNEAFIDTPKKDAVGYGYSFQMKYKPLPSSSHNLTLNTSSSIQATTNKTNKTNKTKKPDASSSHGNTSSSSIAEKVEPPTMNNSETIHSTKVSSVDLEDTHSREDDSEDDLDQPLRGNSNLAEVAGEISTLYYTTALLESTNQENNEFQSHIVSKYPAISSWRDSVQQVLLHDNTKTTNQSTSLLKKTSNVFVFMLGVFAFGTVGMVAYHFSPRRRQGYDIIRDGSSTQFV